MQKLDSIPKICKSFGAYLQGLLVSVVPACGDWDQRETTCGLQFLRKRMNCKKCGAPLNTFYEYCGKCGTKHPYGKNQDGASEKLRDFIDTEDEGGCGCGGSGYDRRNNDGGCDGCARGAAAGGCLDAMDGRGCSDGCFVRGCLAGGCLGSLFG